MEFRCQHWLLKKNRFCANKRLAESRFCGNHNQRPYGQRIPCPIDPSHLILEENLKAHLRKCPNLKQSLLLNLQPFYRKGINGGGASTEEKLGEHEAVIVSATCSEPLENFTSEMKRNAVYSMSVPSFLELISKIKAIHSTACKDINNSYKVPEVCDAWIKREADGKLPFKDKHVVQHASIIGNLEDLGVLPRCVYIDKKEGSCVDESCKDDIDVPSVVDFGAGRGYLTQMLADCYGINRVYLIERKSYKLKADRSLRQKERLVLERLRIDIEDLDLNAVESLQGRQYLAIGKHLCGSATDLTLQCCLGRKSFQYSSVECNGGPCVRGLALATCCHHLCQWKHYMGRKYLSSVGFTKEDFHAITWFTSWAVDAVHHHNLDLLPVKEEEERECLGKEDDWGGIEGVVRSMTSVERAKLGFMCKEVIDKGREMWMKELSDFEAKLVNYVPATISPENHLLIAWSPLNSDHL